MIGVEFKQVEASIAKSVVGVLASRRPGTWSAPSHPNNYSTLPFIHFHRDTHDGCRVGLRTAHRIYIM